MKLAIYGYGGHAKDVASLLKEKVTFFVDDEYSNDNAKPISLFDPEEYKIMIAIGDSQKRRNIVNRLPQNTQFTRPPLGKTWNFGIFLFCLT